MDTDDFARVIPGSGQRVVIGANTVTGENLATGNGTITSFSGATLVHAPVVPGTFSITAGAVVANDNGAGVLTGTGIASGTINYATGAWSVVYTTAPANATAITGAYTYVNVSAALGPQTYAVGVAATGACHIEFDGAIANTKSAFIAANVTMQYFKVAPSTTVSVIADGSATGNCYIVELSR